MDEIKQHRSVAKRVLLILLIASLAANIFLISKLNGQTVTGAATKEFRFIKPLGTISVDSNVQEENVIIHYTGLRDKVERSINSTTSLENVGVFVQDAKTGTWMGINERTGFFPASLLKIPLAMAILKKVDWGEMNLTDKIELVETDLEEGSGNLYKLGAGTQITVWELLKEMLLSSDNTAKNALKRYLSDAEINSVFVHVGIPNPYFDGTYQVTPRGFSRFFKSLYFSTYISPELSEKALDLVSDTRKEDLLSAGIPPEIQVAHKYGESSFGLHDCGIVYHNVNPYFICLMTKNMEPQDEQKLIIEVSKDVFDFVSS